MKTKLKGLKGEKIKTMHERGFNPPVEVEDGVERPGVPGKENVLGALMSFYLNPFQLLYQFMTWSTSMSEPPVEKVFIVDKAVGVAK